MEKQTAVEYLLQELYENFDIDGDVDKFNKIIEQIKQREKNQIILAYKDGRSDQQSPKNSIWFNRKSAEYYNETFKSE